MNKVKQGEYDNLVHVRALYFFEDHSWHCQPAGAIKQSRMGIVMNWYKDGSLRTLLNQTQHHMRGSARLSWTDKLQLAIDVCVGLGKLHDMALLHRDVKADNVLLKKMEDGRMRGASTFW
jgi:serine/threonine protein kinase